MVPRGRQGPSPFVSSASPRGPLALATSQAAHLKFLAHAAHTHLLGLECFDIDIPFIITFSHLIFTQLLLSLVQTFCTGYVLFCLCKVPLQYVIWILPLNRRLQTWLPPLQLRGNFGSVLTALHACLHRKNHYYWCILDFSR